MTWQQLTSDTATHATGMESTQDASMSPEERTRRFGIECVGLYGDGVVFKAGTWKPGGEYIQKLTVRNVSVKLKKLKYQLPKTRYFSLRFPEMIQLSPGMFTVIEVVFRPVQTETYDDTIYFQMNEGAGSGGFHVPVRALISKLSLSLPMGLDMGLCAIHQLTVRSFCMHNTGEIAAPFRWEAPFPFTLYPADGIIAAGSSMDIHVHFRPTDASVFVAQIVCFVGEGVVAIIEHSSLKMKVSGVGKYTFLSLSDTEVDFQEVLVHTPPDAIEKEIVLRNQGMVPAEFKCVRLNEDRDSVFELSLCEGIVQAQSQILIKVRYHSLAHGTFSLDRYEFATPSGHKAILTCKALSIGPHIELIKRQSAHPKLAVEDSLNFNDVELGESSTRVMFFKNNSNMSTRFYFLADADGVFSFDRTHGLIPARMECFVQVTFKPKYPINYYRRMFVLIESEYPTFVDMLGSGFIQARGEIREQRPFPLRKAHVQAFRNRSLQGYGGLSSVELDHMLAEQGMCNLFARPSPQPTLPLFVSTISDPLTRSGESGRAAVAVAHELFIPDSDQSREVFVDRTTLDFGYVQHMTTSDRLTISVTNTARAKITVQWCIPGADPHQAVFQVQPNSMDIPPRQSSSFKVLCRPPMADNTYIIELSGFAFLKNQRTFRLVNDATLTPPWHFAVKAIAHTFSHERFLAKLSLNIRRSKLTFPACHVGDCIFQSVVLRNHSNLPARFEFESDPQDIFSIVPSVGLINAEDFVIACIRFKPEERRTYRFVAQWLANGSTAATALLEGTGAVPSLTSDDLDENCNFCLKPTCVGLLTNRTLRLRNNSRIPLRFQVIRPRESEGILTLDVQSAILLGNEEKHVNIKVAPREATVYRFHVQVKVYSIAGEPPAILDARQLGEPKKPKLYQTLFVNVIILGEAGAITFEPSKVEMDVSLVNTTQAKSFTLINTSTSDIFYELHARRSFALERGNTAMPVNMLCTANTQLGDRPPDSQQTVEPLSDLKSDAELKCSRPCGTLNARSRTSVDLVFCPTSAGQYDFSIMCRIQAIGADGSPIMLSAQEDALVRVGETIREVGTRTLENGNETCDTDAASAGPLCCNVTGRATFPTLVMRDARSEVYTMGQEPEMLWSQLSLQQLNAELSMPLTDEEMLFNMKSSPDLSTLKRFCWEFTPGVINSPRQTLLIQMYNPGYLATSFRLQYPTEKELELEPWADEGDPTEQELQQQATIEEIKCFHVSPREGTLAPGEVLTLTVSYSYISTRYDGNHRLPLLLKVLQGKQLWLDLLGYTLGGNQLLLYIPTSSDPYIGLGLVACGLPLDEAPLQETWLFNPSAMHVEYRINTAPLDVLSAENNNFEVLKIENSQGTIDGRSSVKLRWRFLPLATKSYQAELTLEYSAHGVKKQMTLLVTGHGYDSRESDPYGTPVPSVDLGLEPPSTQLLAYSGQLFTLSVDKIRLGRLPQGASVSRVLIIRNSLLSASIDFHFDCSASTLADHELITFTPAFGRLDPNEFVVIHIYVSAKCSPILFAEYVQVVAREVVKGLQGSRRSRPRSKLQERLLSSRASNLVGRTERESVISRSTITRDTSLSLKSLRSLSKQPASQYDESPAIQPSEASIPVPGKRFHGSKSSVSFSAPRKVNAETATLRGPLARCPLRIQGEVVALETYFSLFPQNIEYPIVIPGRCEYIPANFWDSNREDLIYKSTPLRGGILAKQRESEVRAIVEDTFRTLFADVVQSHEIYLTHHSLRHDKPVLHLNDCKEWKPRRQRMPILHEADEASMVTDGQLQLGLAALAVNQKAACVKQDAIHKEVIDMNDFLTKPPDSAADNFGIALEADKREARQSSIQSTQVHKVQVAATQIQAQLHRATITMVAEFKASVDVLNAAATKIQGLARGKKGRDRANMQREMERAKRSRDIQGDCGFFGAVHEVLRETVFNLMQECVFGEFDVFGEPVQYFIKDHEQR